MKLAHPPVQPCPECAGHAPLVYRHSIVPIRLSDEADPGEVMHLYVCPCTGVQYATSGGKPHRMPPIQEPIAPTRECPHCGQKTHVRVHQGDWHSPSHPSFPRPTAQWVWRCDACEGNEPFQAEHLDEWDWDVGGGVQ